jgi:hypothetical protein
VLLELHTDAQTYVHGIGIRADDVGEQSHPRVVVERHDRDDVGRLDVRQPLLEIDREPDHHSVSRRVDRLELGVVAVAAHDL